MIRDYTPHDRPRMRALLHAALPLLSLENETFWFRPDNRIRVFEADGGIAGFSSFGLWGTLHQNGKLFLHVAPAYRGRGVGTALYGDAAAHVAPLGLSVIEAVCRADNGDAAAFYQRRGYRKWYGEHGLIYGGGKLTQEDLPVVGYTDAYFEPYVQAVCESFLQMRRENDFQPYACMNTGEQQRAALLQNRDNILLWLEDGQIAASATLCPGDPVTFDPIFVTPAFQGRGYGKRITRYAVAEAQKRGVADIALETLEWNTRAVALYTGLGFSIRQTTDSLRLFCKEAES